MQLMMMTLKSACSWIRSIRILHELLFQERTSYDIALISMNIRCFLQRRQRSMDIFINNSKTSKNRLKRIQIILVDMCVS